METKLAKLKKMWAAHDYRAALHLAASWPELGEQRDKITQGWAAVSNEGFYRQLGKDPAVLYRAGLHAVAVRYKLTPPQATCPECHGLSEKTSTVPDKEYYCQWCSVFHGLEGYTHK